ncbi:MAG: hypothetical protein HOL37_05965, partial [Rhodospirillaceae bacterium]|nr:hypothetical protein [Rhodospirillaceae bacterium]
SVDNDTIYGTGTYLNYLYGGSGDDTIVINGTSKILTINGDAGNDTLTIAQGALTGETRVLNGGTDTTYDTLSITGGGSLDDTELASVTAWEVWSLATNATTSLTLDDNNVTSGTTGTFSLANVTAVGDLTFNAAAESNGNVSATIASSVLGTGGGTAATITGGQGTSDTLTFSGGGITLDATELGNVKEWESWVLATNAAYNITLDVDNVTTGSLTINASAVTSATVTLDTTNEATQTINYTGGTGITNLTVKKAMLFSAGNATLTGGSGTSDSLTIFGGGTLSSELANISGWETWTLTGAGDTLTLDAANVAASGALTIDASNQSGVTTTINATAETNGTLNYTGADGTDLLTVSGTMLNTRTAALTGGTGTSDVLNIATGGILDGTELGSISGFETWNLTTDASYDMTLGANNDPTSGALTIGATSVTTANNLAFTAAAEASTSIYMAIASSVIDDDAAHVLTGGGSGGDTLTFSGGATLTSTELGSVSAWEYWYLDTNAIYDLTTAAGNVAASSTLNIIATNVTTAAVTIDATAETNGTIHYTGGNGDNTLTVDYAALTTGTVATLTGGTGANDILNINLPSSGAYTLSNTNTSSISGWESWVLKNDFYSAITIDDDNVASGATLQIDASALVSVYSSNLTMYSVSNDRTVEYTGGTGADYIQLLASSLVGKTVTMTGGESGSYTDTLQMVNFTSSTTVTLDANDLSLITGWERFYLQSLNVTYNVTLNNSNVASGKTLTIDGQSTSAATTLNVNGSAETDGGILDISGAGNADILTGGSGADTISGNYGNDTITGGAGGDTLAGDAGVDTFITVTADVAAAGQASVAYDTLSNFTAGSGGDIFDWDTALSNNSTAIGASAADMGTGDYLSTTISDTVLTAAADTIGIFEFMGSSLGANDIIVGTTTSATIEGWAQTALATVDHIATTDNMLFIMYDNGAIASTAAIFEFTADGTATDIAAAELQLVAVADVTQDTMTFDNIL